jgi:GAF domain-containing protein
VVSGPSGRARALLEAARLVAASASRDLGATLDALADQARALLRADAASLHLAVPGSDDLIRRRANPLAVLGSSFAREGVRFTPSAFIREALAGDRPLFSGRFQTDPRIGPGSREGLPTVVAILAVPLRLENRPVGLLVLNWTRQPKLVADDLSLAEALGHHAAAAIHTAELLEANRRARVELEAVLDAADDSIMVYLADGRLLRANRRARERFVERIGRVPETLDEFIRAARPTRADGSRLDVPLATQALRGETVADTVVYGYPDGPRHFHVHAAPLRDPDGWVWGAALVARDITELRATIGRNAQLDGAIKTARRVAHELNNALTFVAGYGELLPALVPAGDASEMASEMAQAALEAAEIVHRLQRIVRFEERESPVGPMLDLEAAERPSA